LSQARWQPWLIHGLAHWLGGVRGKHRCPELSDLLFRRAQPLVGCLPHVILSMPRVPIFLEDLQGLIDTGVQHSPVPFVRRGWNIESRNDRLQVTFAATAESPHDRHDELVRIRQGVIDSTLGGAIHAPTNDVVPDERPGPSESRPQATHRSTTSYTPSTKCANLRPERSSPSHFYGAQGATRRRQAEPGHLGASIEVFPMRGALTETTRSNASSGALGQRWARSCQTIQAVPRTPRRIRWRRSRAGRRPGSSWFHRRSTRT